MVHVLKQACYCCCILLALVACSSAPTMPISGQPPAPSIVAGKASVSGQVVSSTDHAPIKTTVYLAQVYWDSAHKKAAYALDLGRSPAVITDQTGFFSFSGIDPHEYVIFIGDYYGENDIIREKNGDARVVTAEANKALNVGTLPVKPSVAQKK